MVIMTEGANFRSVPVVDVHGDNFQSLWPAIQNAVSSSDFVALDLVTCRSFIFVALLFVLTAASVFVYFNFMYYF